MNTVESHQQCEPETWVNSKRLRDACISRGVYRFGVLQLIAAVVLIALQQPNTLAEMVAIFLIGGGLGAITTNVNKMHY